MIISSNADEIADILKKGGIIAYPTEAVWGLGCDPFNETAVHTLLALKKRPIEKGMILITGQAKHLKPWSDNLSSELAKKLTTFNETPTTWLVEDNKIAPHWVRGRFTSIAIRLSQHAGVQTLCNAFNGPIVSTSANPAEQEPALSLEQVKEYFSDELDAIYDSELGTAKQPSQIRHLVNEKIVRF